MNGYPYQMRHSDGPYLGLVALQSDQSIEMDFRRLFPAGPSFMSVACPAGQR